MILIFLGSWRSTIIVALSIPLSVLDVDHRAVGVRRDAERDDARRSRARGRHSRRRRDGGDREHPSQPRARGSRCARRSSTAREQIAIPAFVSTLSICIVFLPIFALSGPAAALFRPLALAVIFAMAASYFLSRTLVPTMADYMLPAEAALHPRRADDAHAPGRFGRVVAGFDAAFERFRDQLPLAARRRDAASAHRARRPPRSSSPLSLLLVPSIGQDFFPTVDGGQFQLHVRAPAGHATRGDGAARSRRSSSRSSARFPKRDLVAHPRQHRADDLRRRARRRLERDGRTGGRRPARAADDRITRARPGSTCARCAKSCPRSFPASRSSSSRRTW